MGGGEEEGGGPRFAPRCAAGGPAVLPARAARGALALPQGRCRRGCCCGARGGRGGGGGPRRLTANAAALVRCATLIPTPCRGRRAGWLRLRAAGEERAVRGCIGVVSSASRAVLVVPDGPLQSAVCLPPRWRRPGPSSGCVSFPRADVRMPSPCLGLAPPLVARSCCDADTRGVCVRAPLRGLKCPILLVFVANCSDEREISGVRKRRPLL